MFLVLLRMLCANSVLFLLFLRICCLLGPPGVSWGLLNPAPDAKIQPRQAKSSLGSSNPALQPKDIGFSDKFCLFCGSGVASFFKFFIFPYCILLRWLRGPVFVWSEWRRHGQGIDCPVPHILLHAYFNGAPALFFQFLKLQLG